MRKRFLITWLFLLLEVSSAILAAEQPILLDKIVAIVNDEVITDTQLANAVREAKAAHEEVHAPVANRTALRKEALDELINRTLELQLAKQANLAVTREEVRQAIDQILSQKKLSLSHFKLTLQQQGTSFDFFQKTLQDNLLIQKLQREVLANRILLNPEEVTQFIENYEHANSEFVVRELWVPLEDYPTTTEVSAAKSLAEKYRESWKSGALRWGRTEEEGNFQWIDLGTRRISEFPAVFATPLMTMKEGSLSSVLKADNGYHILELVKHKFPDKSLTEAQAREVLYQEKAKVQLKNWLEEVRDSAYVRIL